VGTGDHGAVQVGREAAGLYPGKLAASAGKRNRTADSGECVREIVPNYTVREVFSAQREEVCQRAARMITQKLAADEIVVKAVMLRDIQLPPEYAKELEELLLNEQENDRMGVETELKGKEVRIAELEAEATKVQQTKQAEGEAQVHVLQAKGEADAMQYTLPLKAKQIQQSRLEAQARKQVTIQNAEAEAQAKVIDSKAEGERRKLLAEAEADRIRVTAVADADRLKSEAAILKDNPLINQIVAERLSDKLQIMMVPADGKFCFANDVLRSMHVANRSGQAERHRWWIVIRGQCSVVGISMIIGHFTRLRNNEV
jgi:regulator of protease activity HflC (stomatin/prohibitin superfamily)